jgi:hypothetical protein
VRSKIVSWTTSTLAESSDARRPFKSFSHCHWTHFQLPRISSCAISSYCLAQQCSEVSSGAK